MPMKAGFAGTCYDPKHPDFSMRTLARVESYRGFVFASLAAGLALRGRVPVVHALATFLTLRAFEFIRTDVGIAGLPVKLVGTVPGFLSEANGPTHQAIEDLALLELPSIVSRIV